MLIGRFTEQPWRDENSGLMGTQSLDLDISNASYVLENPRHGSIFFWDADGAMSPKDQMRSLRLIGQEVIPAVREMGQELETHSAFDVNPAAGQRTEATA